MSEIHGAEDDISLLDGFFIFLFIFLKCKSPPIFCVVPFSSLIGQVVRPLRYSRCIMALSPQSNSRTIQCSVGVLGSRRPSMENSSHVPKMLSPRPKIVFPSLHSLQFHFPSARYFRLGKKCCGWSVRPYPARTVASCSSRWCLKFSSQALRSPTSSFLVPFGPHSNACLIQLVVGRSLDGT